MRKYSAAPHRTLIACLAAAILALAFASGCASGSGGQQGTSEPPEPQTSAPAPEPTSEPTSGPIAGPATGTPVLEVLNDDMKAIYANRDTELPVAVKYWTAGEGGVTVWPAYGEQPVNQTLDAIEDMVVTGETEMVADDDSEAYAFINEDGSIAGTVSFNMGNLEAGGKIYTVSGSGGFAALPFPPAFQFADSYKAIPDPALLEFLGRFEAEDAIASVAVTTNGETKTTTSEDAITDAAETLLYGNVGYAGEPDGSGKDVFDLTFTMEDGTEYTFSFENGSYLYEFPAPIGTWSYYSSSFKDLIRAAG